jgi:8-amino-7-oxononanoate synthase
MRDMEHELQSLREAALYRTLRTVQARSGSRVTVNGRELVLLASNDYLGLSVHPRMRKRACQAVGRWGAGSGSARLISGTVEPFDTLEQEIAAFKKTESALVFSTGYMANVGLLTALAGPQDLICSDALNHASIIDGCRLSRAATAVFDHRDMNHLEQLLRQGQGYRRRIIITDGVFSMDGDIAPLPDLVGLAARYGALLIVDDAHGTGALGRQGRGTFEHFDLDPPENAIIMGTMGKALGCFGAFVAGPACVRECLINRARSFIFTSALPPSVVESAREALMIISEEPGRVARLQENSAYMRRALLRLGYDLCGSRTHIIPVLIGKAATALSMAEGLVEQGLFIPAVRPPAVAEGAARLRLTVMALHTRQDLDTALAILEAAGLHHGLIGKT